MAGADYTARTYRDGQQWPPASEIGSDSGVLGTGRVQIALDKNARATVCRADGSATVIEPQREPGDRDIPIPGYWVERWEQEIDGYLIEVAFVSERLVDPVNGQVEEGRETVISKLVEPDRTVWTGWSGYGCGPDHV